ncbi:MAG: hypothetical protein M0Z89_09245 [Nitrospiraceae bacterium]|nr:hypothetical protein [Nitrospiraceae bacterium]
MENGKIFTVALVITIIHFILTSVIGHYISVQIGTQMGEVVAARLLEASDNNPDKSEEETIRIYQNMKDKSDEILESWKIPSLLISLPVKPLMTPLLREVLQKQVNKVSAQEITKEQFQTRGNIINYLSNFLNSLSLGLMVFILLKIFDLNKKRT